MNYQYEEDFVYDKFSDAWTPQQRDKLNEVKRQARLNWEQKEYDGETIIQREQKRLRQLICGTEPQDAYQVQKAERIIL